MVFERVWWILAWYSSRTTPYSEILGCNPRKHTQTLVYVALSSTEIETKWEKNGIFVCGCISICVLVFGWGTFSCWSCWCTAIMWKWCTYIPPGFAWKIRLWTMQCGNIRMNHQGSLKSIQRCNGHVGNLWVVEVGPVHFKGLKRFEGKPWQTKQHDLIPANTLS